MSEKFKSFVIGQGLPPSVYEKLQATSSKDIYWLGSDEYRVIGAASPAYEERFLSACGDTPEGSSQRNKCRRGMLFPDRQAAMKKMLETK
jgi:hypothetical protein